MLGMMKESQKLPTHVKVWMGVMGLTFMAHFLYLDSPLHVVSLVTFLATLGLVAPLSFKATQNINALALAHFASWPVALAYGLQQSFVIGIKSPDPVANAVLFGGYVIFAVSLVLDYRILLQELRAPALG